MLKKISNLIRKLLRVFAPAGLGFWKGFRKSLLSLLKVGDHPAFAKKNATLFFFCVFFVIIFVWGSIFKIDQIVQTPGQLVSSLHTQTVQTSGEGILVSVNVKEGDSVKKGQTLAVLDTERVGSLYQEALSRVTALKMTTQRLKAEMSGQALAYDKTLYGGFPTLLQSQLNLYAMRQANYTNTLKLAADNLKLAQDEYQTNQKLAEDGDISRIELSRVKRGLNDAENAYNQQKNKYIQDASAELNTAEENLLSQEQVLSERGSLLKHATIVANVDGIVKNIKTTTLGAVLHSGEEIMQIFPTEGTLVVEARVKPADMTNVKVGLPVKVRFDDFDYSTYGELLGTVTYASEDSITEESKTGSMVFYRVVIAVNSDQSSDSKIRLKPGMTAIVDIKTGERSVFGYLFKPITKTISNSMIEK